MSHQRSARIKRSSKLNRQIKNSNALVFKLVDPIVQFLIFIYFLYCLDAEASGASVVSALYKLVGWQLVSVAANFFIKDPKIMRGQRLSFAIIIVAYMGLFYFVTTHVRERLIGINETDVPYLPVHQTLLIAGALALSFWYNFICYREVKGMMPMASKER